MGDMGSGQWAHTYAYSTVHHKRFATIINTVNKQQFQLQLKQFHVKTMENSYPAIAFKRSYKFLLYDISCFCTYS